MLLPLKIGAEHHLLAVMALHIRERELRLLLPLGRRLILIYHQDWEGRLLTVLGGIDGDDTGAYPLIGGELSLHWARVEGACTILQGGRWLMARFHLLRRLQGLGAAQGRIAVRVLLILFFLNSQPLSMWYHLSELLAI